MEENSNYTYTYEDEEQTPAPERSLKVIFGFVIAGLAVLAIALGIFFGIRSAGKEEETTLPPSTSEPTSSEAPSSALNPYKTGLYSIETEGVPLKLRKDHASNSETLLTVPNKTKVEVIEIFSDDTTADEDFKYWGRITHLGHTGWVSMKYLKKAYSDNVVTPDDVTSSTEAESASSSTSEPSSSVASISSTTDAPSSTAASEQKSKYPTGKYSVSAGGQGLNVRSGAGSDNAKVDFINDGTAVTVLEVVDTKGSNETTRYWGKISYDGKTGYVCMAYLKK